MGSTDSLGSLVARTAEATNHMVVVEVGILSAQGLQWPQARGLKRLKFWSSIMWPYVNAWISPDDQDTKTSTKDSEGPNPVWEDLLLVVCNKEQIFSKNAELKLEVLHRSSGVGKNKHLGTATIALSHVHFSDPSKVFVCPLVQTSGREQGVIEFTMTIKPCVRPNFKCHVGSTSVTSSTSPEYHQATGLFLTSTNDEVEDTSSSTEQLQEFSSKGRWIYGSLSVATSLMISF
jgi:hypothetical protein